MRTHTEYVDVDGTPCRFELIIRKCGPVFAARVDVNRPTWMFGRYFDMMHRQDAYSNTAATNLLFPSGYTVDTVSVVDTAEDGFLAVTGHLSNWKPKDVGEWVL